MWIDKLKVLVTELEESETFSSIANRNKANKVSPLNEWTNNFDTEELIEENYEFESMLKNFVALQKQARADAKKETPIKRLC